MRSRLTVFLALLTFAAVALPVFSQAPARPARTKIASSQQQTAFTAEYKITTVKTLANGSTITREQTEVQAADSHGRVVTSTTTTEPEAEQRTITTVVDHAAGTRTTWSTSGQQATATSLRPSAAAAGCADRMAHSAPPTALRIAKTEDLGVETIEGVEAHGHRTTVTTPAGLIGNSQPLVSTNESWVATTIKPFSPVLRQNDDDPLSGTTTREATKVTLGEPDESLFQPPSGYEVVTRDANPAPCTAARTVAAPTEPAQ